ncbi:hypothetical protein [Aporhodopirellula aestuarii]|uniref:Uncharacterized protein n=1 Tax=Aporhodopirellula aestuarii TaxID=2950107 RepID=A0ABT0U5W1_9BACT|nr:hypothetical protein [Aporhodopirellula aestuarii]MCM2372319.1 hypothetical protein [Aporhodopirellula aestuarii]
MTIISKLNVCVLGAVTAVLLEYAGSRRRSDRPNSGASYDYLVAIAN